MTTHNPSKKRAKKSRTFEATINPDGRIAKKEKYDFKKMKAAATSEDPTVRKVAFTEYFERFNEFPSFLFDNEYKIDVMLAVTIRDIAKDPQSSKSLLEGIEALLHRLPSAD